MKTILILCSLCIYLNRISIAKQLPSFIKKCSKSDPIKLEKCLLERIEDLKPRLIQGIPELKLPPIEPLSFPKLEIHTGNRINLAFDAVLNNITARGVKDLHALQMEFDFEKHTVHMHFRIPKLEVHGNYDFNGKVLIFQIASKGSLRLNVSNIDAKTNVKFSITEKEGKKYLYFQNDYKLNNKYEYASIYFEDLFPTNQQLTEQVNAAINENFLEIATELNPLVFDSLHLLVMGIISPIFNEYSLEELFED